MRAVFIVWPGNVAPSRSQDPWPGNVVQSRLFGKSCGWTTRSGHTTLCPFGTQYGKGV